jgi:hypothetical protein
MRDLDQLEGGERDKRRMDLITITYELMSAKYLVRNGGAERRFVMMICT